MTDLSPDLFSDPFKSSALSSQPVSTRTYNPERSRETIRGAVAITAMVIFALVIGFYIFYSVRASNATIWDHLKEAMQAVLPAVTSVLGTVLGFYFGSQKR